MWPDCSLFISVNFQIGSLNPYIPETQSNIPGNLSMDNQSRSSFWQGLFKQREWGGKKKRSPEQILFILQRGPQMAATWLPQPSSLTVPPPFLLHKVSPWVQRWAWPKFTSSDVCWTPTAGKTLLTGNPARESQCSKLRVFFSVVVVLGHKHVSVFAASEHSCQGRCLSCCQMGTECATHVSGALGNFS